MRLGFHKVTLAQSRYFYDRARFQAGNDQLWKIPVCLKAGGDAGGKATGKCELLTKREASLTLPGCASWVLANAGATGYYRSGYQPEAMLALAHHAESSLTPAERIALLSDAWSSVRVGRESISDYLVLAEGLKMDSNRAVMEQLLGQLDEIGRNLVNDHDREAYQGWVRHLLAPALERVGLNPKPGDTDEQKNMRARLILTLGLTGRDSAALTEAHKVTEQVLENPLSVDRELAFTAFRLAALNGDVGLYDKIMASP